MKLGGLFLVILALFVTPEASNEQHGGEFAHPMSNDANKEMLNILMPDVKPTKHDTYFCTSAKISQDVGRYIVQYVPHAEMNTAHHMLMFGCEVPASTDQYWNCGDMGKGVCGRGSEKIMYAWGRNAPPLKLPDDVAFPVGGKTKVNYIVLQVHYGHVDKFLENKDLTDNSGVTLVSTSVKQKYTASIDLMAAGWSYIPSRSPAWHLDTGCQYYGKTTIHPFAFRVHAHSLGTVISGYRVRNGEWTLIGKGDPQRPQAFYPMDNKAVDIEPGDILAARCTYNSMSRDRITYIGATMKDEMCNFYTMYYFDSQDASATNPTDYCDPVDDRLFDEIPVDSDRPLPSDGDSMKMDMKRRVLGSCQENCDGSLVVQKNWPEGGATDGQLPIKTGQITAVDIDTNGDVVIFHRADREWGLNSFDNDNKFTEVGLGPIAEDTVLWLNPETGSITRSWGKGLFYMPHGLTIDTKGNLWLTDVAMHQVFKFPPGGSDAPALQLGTKFQPGNTYNQFCKPTDVAVDSQGNFFVSDGYCNTRILKFSPQGTPMLVIDNSALQSVPVPTSFDIPHSVSLDQVRQRLFVADRENGRVLVFDAVSGIVVGILQGFGSRVFAIHYHPGQGDGVLHVVNGNDGHTPIQGYTVNLNTETVVQTWGPAEGFIQPHDVSADNSGAVYVTEIGPNRIWKFVLH